MAGQRRMPRDCQNGGIVKESRLERAKLERWACENGHFLPLRVFRDEMVSLCVHFLGLMAGHASESENDINYFV